MLTSRKVLLAPQHWGLGHVTRTIPVIRYFIDRGWEVYLASSDAGSDLLRREFPSLPVFELPDYKINYPSKNMYWNMAIQLYKMHSAIWKENRVIRKLCKEYKINLLVSDARLGAAQSRVKSVIITHHLHFPLPFKFFEWCADTWMRFFYLQFDEIWIPDFQDEPNLSGLLAHQFKSKKHYYIGALSRFKKLDLDTRYNYCFMLSGPEPQRTRLEDRIVSQLQSIEFQKVVLIRGTTKAHSISVPANVDVIDLATSEQINSIMCSSDLIICRSGYSTLLDLSVIQKKALLIPTPGQPEQEYLGRELHRKKMFFCIDQDALDLSKQIPVAMEFSSYAGYRENNYLYDILDTRINLLFKK